MASIYTDLALEEREKFKEDVEVSGVVVDSDFDEEYNMTTTVVKIINKNGEKQMGKPMGTYITMETNQLKDIESQNNRKIIKKLAGILKKIIGNNIKKVLIVGLGNAYATPDALGPRVADKIICKENVCCIAPGVLAQTGMEASKVIKGIISQIKPDAVIVIDSLTARNVRRITTTIQLTDTGITPGSGVGNHREPLDKKSLGCPVIAMGVPMVVSGATIVSDTVDRLMNIARTINEENEISKILSRYSADEKYSLFEELLGEETEQMFVTPKDVDEIVTNISDVIAASINEYFITLEKE